MDTFNEMLEMWFSDFYKKVDPGFFTTYLEKNIIIEKCDHSECNCIEQWEDSPVEIKIASWWSKITYEQKLKFIDNYMDFHIFIRDNLREKTDELENKIEMLEEKLEHYEEIPPAYNSDDSSLTSEQN